MFSWIKPIIQREENATNSGNTGDKEEDGFLVVGQTRSEKTTIIASEFKPDTGRPPSCMEVSDDKILPNYHAALSKDYSLHQHSGQYSVSEGAPLDYSVTSSAINDIPFCINPKLQSMWGIGKLPTLRCFDPSKYDYDFSLEYSIVDSNPNVWE